MSGDSSVNNIPGALIYLSELNIETTPLALKMFDNNVDSDINVAPLPRFDDRIEFDMPVGLAQSLFRFITDSIDGDDLDDKDVFFRVAADIFDGALMSYFHTRNLAGPVDRYNTIEDNFDAECAFGPHFLVRDKFISTLKYTTLTNKSLGDNQLRFVALNLFNTINGVDLFVNEDEFRNDLDERIDATIIKNLRQWFDQSSILSNAGELIAAKIGSPFLKRLEIRDTEPTSYPTAGGITLNQAIAYNNANNPGKQIYKYLLRKHPERFVNLHPVPADFTPDIVKAIHPGDENSYEYYLPLLHGDKLAFTIKVNTPGTQTDIITPRDPQDAVVAVPSVTYLVIANLKLDGTEGVINNPDYRNVWDTNHIQEKYYSEFVQKVNALGTSKVNLGTKFASYNTAKDAADAGRANTSLPYEDLKSLERAQEVAHDNYDAAFSLYRAAELNANSAYNLLNRIMYPNADDVLATAKITFNSDGTTINPNAASNLAYNAVTVVAALPWSSA